MFSEDEILIYLHVAATPCTGKYDPQSSSMGKRQFRLIQLNNPVKFPPF